MDVIYKGNILKKVEDWHKYLYPTDNRHWKSGCSAESLTQFICNNDGIHVLEELLSEIFNESVYIDSAEPEKYIKFDKYGTGRAHDLAITAHSVSGKNIFIGVEAKVNETFDFTIADKYLSSVTKHLNNENSNLCKRIESLMKRFFIGDIKKEDFKLRYQLLQAIAGVLSSDKAMNRCFDNHIFLALTFLNDRTNKKNLKSNYDDFNKFVNRLNAATYNGIKDTYGLNIENSNLIMAYRKIKL